MDQDKTDIPHIISKPKAMAGAATLETHVTGARAHGQLTVMAIDCGQYPHDSNLILLRLFKELKVILNNIIKGILSIAPCCVSPNGQCVPR